MSTLLTLLLAFGGGDEIRLELRPEIMVRGIEVQLRDFADVTCTDAELRDRIGRVSIGKRPALGNTRVVTREELGQRLLAAGVATDRVHVFGAREVSLVPAFALLQAREVLEAADGVLRAALALEADADIEAEAGSLAIQHVPPGRTGYDLSAEVRNGRLEAKSAIVDVRVLVDGEPWKTIPVPYKLRRYRQALVVTAPVPRGQPLTAENVTLKRVEVQLGNALFVDSPEAVTGMVSARNLTANRLLQPQDVAAPAVVRRGDLVTIVSQKGRVKVATKGIAEQDGAVGTLVAVRNLTSQRVLAAVVQGHGVVAVEPQ